MRAEERAIHKAQLYRLLAAIADENTLPQHIAFKGGTCATMLGYLDRFSVDLDFDFLGTIKKQVARKILYRLFDALKLEIKDESKKAMRFFLKYDAPEQSRNTIKLEILDKQFKNNKYTIKYFPDIDRSFCCQTIEAMFANKLVAITARFNNTGNIAGRDLYDICHFLKQGYVWNNKLIKERTQLETIGYLGKLHAFIKEKFTQKIIDQDLNMLLPPKDFRQIRKTLKQDTLIFLRQYIHTHK